MEHDNYVHSGTRGDRKYTLNGVSYYLDTMCSACKYDLGTHGGAACLRGGYTRGAGKFTPMLAFPIELLLPNGA